MKKNMISMLFMGSLMALGTQVAFAAPDWSKVPKREVSVFHPGVTPMEWVGKKSAHSGTAGLKKGETCVGCHEEKGGLNFNFKRLADKELEPKGAPATMVYPVAVQAAYDASSLYIRLTFKAPPSGGADHSDKDNELKATVMFPDSKVPLASQVGCWASCHGDARTMPGADDKKTKYVKEGKYELMQWRSAKGAKVADGTVTTERKMEGGSLGAKAEGTKAGDTYTITFTRNNPGEGKTIPFGFAIHDDHASGRFHHVSLGYTLGIGAEGDIKATKQ
ncbi:ethylbenzene dehydrogenase-related protein [Simplicispira psychrophila]|uniref:ethylbenzene dehydrogenase-related protein n=1 Tax=Simplicispira psychrophila TaxID=80882 RepID=UPI0004801BD1|nr:ethylbenzene dehydrogenase-related protein [Simplicispira psychrophila]